MKKRAFRRLPSVFIVITMILLGLASMLAPMFWIFLFLYSMHDPGLYSFEPVHPMRSEFGSISLVLTIVSVVAWVIIYFIAQKIKLSES